MTKKLISVFAMVTVMAIAIPMLTLAAESKNENDSGLLTEKIRPVSGPKRVIAVAKFAGLGSMEAKYGKWDVGGGLGAMLTTALIESDEFIVVERAGISQILQELQMAGEGVTSEGSGPALGKLYGAQLLVFGAVTEFGTAFSGSGASAGGAVSDSTNKNLKVGASFSKQMSKGHIAMDIRIVDTTTGSIVSSFRVEEKIESKSYDASIDLLSISFGGQNFRKTPIGGASRKAITRAVQSIAEVAEVNEWVGQVVEVENFEVYINAGERSGIKYGDVFEIQRIQKTFTDPQTGRVLSQRKKTLGYLEVSGIEAEIAYGMYKPIDTEQPAREDVVVIFDGS